MGSTGHSLYSKSSTGNVNTENFGVANAVNFKGSIPADSGLDAVGNNKITLKLPAIDRTNILFQFKLTNGGKLMTITGFKDGVPEVKCKVAVDSGQPSLNALLATGSKSEKLNAVKMKDLFAKSTQFSENQLGAIANKLIQHQKTKGGN